MSDESLPSHSQVTQEDDTITPNMFREMLQVRERELEEPIMQPTTVMPCDERCFAGHAHREGSSKRVNG